LILLGNNLRTIMKRRQILMGGILMLPNFIFATTTKSFPKRDVSGKVVDINKRHSIIVMAEYKGWDREQMTLARSGAKSAIQHWLDGIGPKNAAIFLKGEDVAKLKKGDRIQIAEYSFAFGSTGPGTYVLPFYKKLEITEK
jgi:hypothetical protein